jgi:hypothetical protein
LSGVGVGAVCELKPDGDAVGVAFDAPGAGESRDEVESVAAGGIVLSERASDGSVGAGVVKLEV